MQPELILYSRHACHLCDVMQSELEQILADTGCSLRIEDVDSREDWRTRYGQYVPVLETVDGDELCHYHLDEQKLRSWLTLEAGKSLSR